MGPGFVELHELQEFALYQGQFLRQSSSLGTGIRFLEEGIVLYTV